MLKKFDGHKSEIRNLVGETSHKTSHSIKPALDNLITDTQSECYLKF